MTDHTDHTDHTSHGPSDCGACYDLERQKRDAEIEAAKIREGWAKRAQPDLYPLAYRQSGIIHSSDCHMIEQGLREAEATLGTDEYFATVPKFTTYERVLPLVRERKARGAMCCAPALPAPPGPRVRYTGVTSHQRDAAVKSLEKILGNPETPVADEDAAALRRAVDILTGLGDLPSGGWIFPDQDTHH